MAAVFGWVEYNATAGDTSTPTNLNLGSTNSTDLVPSTYPITAGTRSYSKWVVGNWSGSFTRIENLQLWCSNSNGGYVTGETIWFSGTTSSYGGTDTYVTPTTAEDAQADQALVFSDPGAAASANIGIGGSLTGSLTATGNSDFIVIQASITDTAGPGATNQKEFTLSYDEV